VKIEDAVERFATKSVSQSELFDVAAADGVNLVDVAMLFKQGSQRSLENDMNLYVP
jgi:hypothetical protein